MIWQTVACIDLLEIEVVLGRGMQLQKVSEIEIERRQLHVAGTAEKCLAQSPHSKTDLGLTGSG